MITEKIRPALIINAGHAISIKRPTPEARKETTEKTRAAYTYEL
jgi:hypothetical protein